MKPPTSITVLVDTREQRPLLFPANIKVWEYGGKPQLVKIKTKRIGLATADYALQGHEATALVERKGSLDELGKNLTSPDRRRQFAEFIRLRDTTANALIVIDENPVRLLDVTERSNPDMVLTELFSAMNRHDLRLMVVGGTKTTTGRRKLGEFVVRWLLSICYGDKNAKTPA